MPKKINKIKEINKKEERRQMSYNNSRSLIGFCAAHARKESGGTYEETNCHGKSCLKVFEATTYIIKHGRRWLERHWCMCER